MAPIDDPNNGVGRLARELREARSRRGLTRRELASRINRSLTTIQRAEAGGAADGDDDRETEVPLRGEETLFGSV
ncbi:helix-turn-helix domain-containing protein [Streptomyces sp. NPDC001732]